MSKRLGKFAAAAVIYAGFAVYLYRPYLKNFHTLQYLLLINACLASSGCFVLSRRWVIGFTGSFFAGAIYGFGPFLLGIDRFHPTAGFLVAMVPWLFCPAAFGPKTKWRWLSWPLSALPFVVILLFFQVAAFYRLFAVPIQAKLHLADLAGLLAPLVAAERNLTLLGFYHIPITALVIGFSMLLAARRFGVMIIFAIGTILASCDSFLGISPIIWLAVPVLCCSVLIGTGTQGLISAGFADRKWLLSIVAVMAALSIVTLLLATKFYQISAGLADSSAGLFLQSARMYILGAIAVGILFFMARANLRIRWLRAILLYSTTAVDIFFGARFIVDKIF